MSSTSATEQGSEFATELGKRLFHPFNRSQENLQRVERLLAIYRDLPKLRSGKGASPTSASDVLRSAVVFLHATLEDMVRTVEIHFSAEASEEALKRIPFSYRGKKTSEPTLGLLAPYKGKMVDEVIRDQMHSRLSRKTYSSEVELVAALEACSLELPAVYQKAFPRIKLLMARRHQIVHHADRRVVAVGNESTTPDADPIRFRDVVAWHKATEAMAVGIFVAVVNRVADKYPEWKELVTSKSSRLA